MLMVICGKLLVDLTLQKTLLQRQVPCWDNGVFLPADIKGLDRRISSPEKPYSEQSHSWFQIQRCLRAYK